uniref:Glycosyltransferase family 92 protein n=1 Tax=Parastrongyloides trichosuri TaxID=131310 RepID=A0A0N5A5D2_PARTI
MLSLIIFGAILGVSFYYRTTNIWMLKNLGDGFLKRTEGLRPIILGAFNRMENEKNIKGDYAVIQYLSHIFDNQKLYCISKSNDDDKPLITTGLIQRIHKGKRSMNDICSWSSHLAECQIVSSNLNYITLSTSSDIKEIKNGMKILLEPPVIRQVKEPLVVCIAPMYIYTEWQIMLTGIESWLPLGATKIIIPIQSVSNTVMNILKRYEREQKVILRYWPKWPVMNDINPNGLVLSWGIEESHVNCLHFAKSFAELIAFSDIDDIFIPVNPMNAKPGYNLNLLHSLFEEHPQAGTLLFEHRDTQLQLPKKTSKEKTLNDFNFDFLQNTKVKQSCRVWRMKTRVVVNASRVDTVNMHESGINRFGYTQVRLPCRQAHFYHLRHSYRNLPSQSSDRVNMSTIVSLLNNQFKHRLSTTLSTISNLPISESLLDTFRDFDECVKAVNKEHFTLKVSRCMTPSACFARPPSSNMNCTAATTDYSFARIGADFISAPGIYKFIPSSDCDAPIPKYTTGNSFYLP